MEQQKYRREALLERYFENKSHYTSLQDLEYQSSSIAELIERLERTEFDPSRIAGVLTDLVQYKSSQDSLTVGSRAAFDVWAERDFLRDMGDLNYLGKVMK